MCEDYNRIFSIKISLYNYYFSTLNNKTQIIEKKDLKKEKKKIGQLN